MKSISRRRLLSQTSRLATGLPIATSPVATGAAQSGGASEPKRRLKVILTGGHLGDPEYGCGGTIARYTDLGHEVILLYLNRGEWPPKDEGASRVAEAKTEPRKRQACYAHASQSPNRYYALQEQVTRLRGIESGHPHAEGFIRHVQSPDFNLPLA